MAETRVLILGASGMLGHALLWALSREPNIAVRGTVRRLAPLAGLLPRRCLALISEGVDAADPQSIARAMDAVAPHVVVNCIGLIRQLPEGRDPLACIEVNARLPHLLLALCRQRGCRLVHYSTDCVFDGSKGAPYVEDDKPTAADVYGLSKYLGELREAPALTVRTSIIGHELRNRKSLLEWLLSCQGRVRGFTRAIFSGLPATEHANVLSRHILPNPGLAGLFHVAGQPVSKHELLSLAAREYGLDVALAPDDSAGEDKRLSADRFRQATGYAAPGWPALIAAMRRSHHDLQTEIQKETA